MVESAQTSEQREAPVEQTEQLVLTIDAGSGDVAKVERIDKAGNRHELSDDELAKLAGEDEIEELEAALEEAFETGAAAALGEDEEDEEEEEGAGATLKHQLRRQLLMRLLLRRLIRRRVLQRRLQR